MKLITLSHVRRWFPKRPREAHKGSCGRVYILAGSRGMVGAGVLCAWGAARGGAGLVRLGVVRSQQFLAVKRGPLEVTTQGLPEGTTGLLATSAAPKIKKSLNQFKPDVLAIGPGLGVASSVQKIVRGLVVRGRIPVVLDADGLNNMNRTAKLGARGPLIITPHPGELGRLMRRSGSQIQKNREEVAKKMALRWGCLCVLKGAGTLVTDGNTVWKNTTGNPGMATGGTGDVLTGLIAALWAQMKEKDMASGLRAACIGVYVHGLAGDLAARKKSRAGMLASDLVEMIPEALKIVEENV